MHKNVLEQPPKPRNFGQSFYAHGMLCVPVKQAERLQSYD